MDPESVFPFETLMEDSAAVAGSTTECCWCWCWCWYPCLRANNPGPNTNDDNSCSAFYYQMPSADEAVLVELLADLVEQPFYDSLRTKQQLGYIVYSGVRFKEGFVSALCGAVLSDDGPHRQSA